VEPSGRNQYCNHRANCEKALKTAKIALPFVSCLGRIVKKSDTREGRHGPRQALGALIANGARRYL
jgi:hypothetical protein